MKKLILFIGCISLATLPFPAHAELSVGEKVAGGFAGLGLAVMGVGYIVVMNSGRAGLVHDSANSSAGLITVIGGAGTAIAGGGTAAAIYFSKEEDPVKALLKTPEFQELANARGMERTRRIALQIVAGLTPEELAQKNPDVFTQEDAMKISRELQVANEE